MKKATVSILLLYFLCNYQIVAQTVSLDTNKINAIETLVEKGLLKFDFSLNKAWVSPSVWKQYNVDGKESFTVLCALYTKHRKKDTSNSYPEIDLFDYNSGKQIASLGSIRGFRILN
jgi:hypothetical protein